MAPASGANRYVRLDYCLPDNDYTDNATQNLYYKAYAYRCKPLKKQGYLSIDGEKYPFGEFHVECHQGLGTMMSCYGHYVTEDNAALKPPPAKVPR